MEAVADTDTGRTLNQLEAYFKQYSHMPREVCSSMIYCATAIGLPMRRRVGLGRDVDYDQPIDGTGVARGELHGHLAAHGVAEQIGAIDVVAGKKFSQIVRHSGIMHHQTTRRCVVIS